MMILTISRAVGRQHDSQDWLESWRTFPASTVEAAGVDDDVPLLVINDDRVAGGSGFGQHPHRDMQILSYPLEGILEHKDSLGNGSRIGPGELQLMTAGTGIRHSEFNGSPTEPLRFLQIWIKPRRKGLAPGYQQIRFDRAARLTHLAAPDSAGNAATLHQDINLWRAALARDETVCVPAGPAQLLWIHVVGGALWLHGQTLEAGDGAALVSRADLELQGNAEANEVLIFVMNRFSRLESTGPSETGIR